MIEHNHEQNTPEWFAARLGVPSASNAKKLITSTGEPVKASVMQAYAKVLAGEKYANASIGGWNGNADTDYGHEMEEEAALWYSMERDIDVQTVGFCTDDLGRYGASPDRMIGGGGLLEIKCFPKTHMDAIFYWDKHKRAQPSEVAQPHMQMLVCDEPWCDLLYYHPVLPKVIVRIERDPLMDKALKTQISAVIAERDANIKTLERIAA